MTDIFCTSQQKNNTLTAEQLTHLCATMGCIHISIGFISLLLFPKFYCFSLPLHFENNSLLNKTHRFR